MKTLETQIESLLDRDVTSVRIWEQQAFSEEAGPSPKIVIFGAGTFGRRIASVLRDRNYDVIAFCDNNPAKWGSKIQGLEVLAPNEAARIHGSSAAFLLSIWHPSLESSILKITAQLKGLGCSRVVAFPKLLWKESASFLPYYLWDLPSHLIEERAKVKEAFNLFDDELSRSVFVSAVRLRTCADFASYSKPVGGEQYFQPSLYRSLSDEVFVDAGAFDGDSLTAFLEMVGMQFEKIIAIEGDPANAELLRSKIGQYNSVKNRIEVHQVALGDSNGTVKFSATGAANASIAADGIEVRRATLDSLLNGQRASLIKMDIEGAEFDSLLGSQEVIMRYQPVLAICAYHLQEDLWRIPALLKKLQPKSKLYLRPHQADGFDLVCYSVPHNRLPESR